MIINFTEHYPAAIIKVLDLILHHHQNLKNIYTIYSGPQDFFPTKSEIAKKLSQKPTNIDL